RKLPEIYDQESCILAGEVGIVEEDYSWLASSEDRVRPMAEAVGQHRAVILPNHGSVATAARATGMAPRAISMERALAAQREIGRIPFLQPLWEDLLKRLRQTDPDLFATCAVGAGKRP